MFNRKTDQKTRKTQHNNVYPSWVRTARVSGRDLPCLLRKSLNQAPSPSEHLAICWAAFKILLFPPQRLFNGDSWPHDAGSPCSFVESRPWFISGSGELLLFPWPPLARAQVQERPGKRSSCAVKVCSIQDSLSLVEPDPGDARTYFLSGDGGRRWVWAGR